MHKPPDWFRIDNAGKLFPSTLSDRLTNLFRLSVTLRSPVDRRALQDSLDAILPRFPYFRVRLRPGTFWYNLTYKEAQARVIDDGAYPCMPLKKSLKEEHLFRVRVRGNRIAAEFNHALTDGTGALIFLKSLLGDYLKRTQGLASLPDEVFQPGQTPDPREWEDSFSSNNPGSLPPPPTLPRAFQLPWKLSPKGTYYSTVGYLPLDQLLERAKAAKVSLTSYLFALVFQSLIQLLDELPPGQKKWLSRPITLLCPVNLRSVFDSRTMKNFFLTVPVTVDPRLGSWPLEDLVPYVHSQLRVALDRRHLVQRLAHNLRGEVWPLLRIIPLFLKNLIISSVFNSEVRGTTGSLSNLGSVSLPEDWKTHVKSFEFLPLPNPITKFALSVISYDNVLAVGFGRMTTEPELERLFFTNLRTSGIPVRIESNFGG